MSVTPSAIIASQQLTNSNATYYTSTNLRTIIDKMTVCNTTGGAQTVTIDLVDSGGTAGVTERIISARAIAPGETYTCPEAVGHVLNAGDSIQGLSSASTALTIRASGRLVAGV